MSDSIVAPERSLLAAANFESSYLVQHDKAHLVPCNKEVRKRFRSFVMKEVYADDGVSAVLSG